MIQTLGHWKSSANLTYVKIAPDLHLNQAFKLNQNLQVEVMTLRRTIVGRYINANQQDQH